MEYLKIKIYQLRNYLLFYLDFLVCILLRYDFLYYIEIRTRNLA